MKKNSSTWATMEHSQRRSQSPNDTPEAAVLVSGGVDSAILCVDLLGDYSRVHPIYVKFGLRWESAELDHLGAFLTALRPRYPDIAPLTVLEEPIAQVYGAHWSNVGRPGVPGCQAADEAVYLPGRNVLLAAKAAVWCRLRDIEILAFGILKGNPFPDSTPKLFNDYEAVLNQAMDGRLRMIRPYEQLSKIEVIARGAGMPLHLTFSCLDPSDGNHCGVCNKCQERRDAFRQAGWPDSTVYAASPATILQNEPHACTE